MKRALVLFLLCGLLPVVWAAEEPAAGDDASFTFGAIADCQYADCDTNGRRHYRDSLAKLEKAVTDLNANELRFVIQLGDLIDRDVAGFDCLLPVYARLKADRYHVLGNHDFSVPDEAKPKVPEKLGMKSRYYAFEVGETQLDVKGYGREADRTLKIRPVE